VAKYVVDALVEEDDEREDGMALAEEQKGDVKNRSFFDQSLNFMEAMKRVI
jgi:hypothetical protein